MIPPYFLLPLVAADFQALSRSLFLLTSGFPLSLAVYSCLFIQSFIVISLHLKIQTQSLSELVFFSSCSSPPCASSQEVPVLFVLY